MADTRINCRKCNGTVLVPEVGPAEREAIAALRPNNAVRAMKAIIDATGWHVVEAKRTALHLTQKRGLCHRCGGVLTERIGLCSGCGSANIDWLPDAG